MENQSLFDPEKGAELRDEAIEKVEEHAEPSWFDVARSTLVYVATRNSRFTADDVAEELGRMVPKITTHEPRAMGAVFKWAQRERIADPTSEFVPTRRAQGHAGPRRVWKSLIV